MSNRIKIPSPLRQFTDNKSYVEVDGLTIKEVLIKIFEQYPQIQSHILDNNGEMRNFVNIYVNGKNIKEKDNLDTSVPIDSDIRIIPAIAGGLEENPNLDKNEINRYARHFSLPEFGIEGQKKLKTAKVCKYLISS